MSQSSDRLALYLAAEADVLRGQEVLFENRRLRRADLEFIQKEIEKLRLLVAREQAAAAGNGRSGFGSALADFSRGEGCGRRGDYR